MRIFCYTCHKSFAAGEDEILADNGTSLAIFKCSTCGTMYLAVDDGKTDLPRLMKLSQTKSSVIDAEKPKPSKLVTPAQQRLVITPAEASALIRQGRR